MKSLEGERAAPPTMLMTVPLIVSEATTDDKVELRHEILERSHQSFLHLTVPKIPPLVAPAELIKMSACPNCSRN